jgi:hypothetical protein
MPSTPELSILIPTVSARASLLSRLLWTLQPQLSPDVEVLIVRDRPMGEAFNKLFAEAQGRLGVIVDDDDLVTPEYVQTVVESAMGADYIGYRMLYTISGCYREVYVSDPTRAAHQPYRLDVTLRHVAHHCPILVKQAQKYQFGQDYGADYHWVMQLIEDGYPHNPVYIDQALYHYDYWPQFTTMTGTSSQRYVGEWPYDPSLFTWLEEV